MTVILTVKERLTKVETQLQEFKEQLDKIATNHLPHIQGEISSLRTDMQKEIGQLREEMQKGFNETNTKIDALCVDQAVKKSWIENIKPFLGYAAAAVITFLVTWGFTGHF